MPEIGDTKLARELGHKGTARYIYEACPECDIPRWVRKGENGRLCPKCAHNEMAMKRRATAGASGRAFIYASKLGREVKQDYLLYEDSCPSCKNKFWRKPSHFGNMCPNCRLKELGLRVRVQNDAKGKHKYIRVKLPSDSPYFEMTDKNGRVGEHRLIMARMLGRPLKPWEIVHHKNGIQDENKESNLELLPRQTAHMPSIRLTQHVNILEHKVKKLERSNKELEEQLEEWKGKMIQLEAEIVQLRKGEMPNSWLNRDGRVENNA